MEFNCQDYEKQREVRLYQKDKEKLKCSLLTVIIISSYVTMVNYKYDIQGFYNQVTGTNIIHTLTDIRAIVYSIGIISKVNNRNDIYNESI